jgi:hypothetical protein
VFLLSPSIPKPSSQDRTGTSLKTAPGFGLIRRRRQITAGAESTASAEQTCVSYLSTLLQWPPVLPLGLSFSQALSSHVTDVALGFDGERKSSIVFFCCLRTGKARSSGIAWSGQVPLLTPFWGPRTAPRVMQLGIAWCQVRRGEVI